MPQLERLAWLPRAPFCSLKPLPATPPCRAKRPPEPYKGKGVRYSDEIVRRKEGKKGK